MQLQEQHSGHFSMFGNIVRIAEHSAGVESDEILSKLILTGIQHNHRSHNRPECSSLYDLAHLRPSQDPRSQWGR